MTQFKISRTDTTTDYAENKITAGDGVTITKVSDGGYETLEISAASQVTPVTSTDGYQVTVSGDDTTPSFLENKLVAGSNVELTVINDGGNETLRIDVLDQIDESLIGAFQDGYTIKITDDDTQASFLQNKLVAGSNVELVVINDGGNETLRIDVLDVGLDGLDNTVTEHYHQHSEALDLIRQAMDGYSAVSIAGLYSTVDEHYNQQGQINQSVLQALDGYAQNSTVTENLNAQKQINQSVLQALDAYGAGATEMEHYNQQGQINQSILQALDGYAQNVTVTEHYSQLGIAIDHLRTAADAYGAGATETEHYNQQQQINQTIIQALDGYAPELTFQQFKNAQYQINQSIIQVLDGYSSTETEHYNQQLQVNQSIIQSLDAYGVNIDEHYRQHSDALNNIRTELDGYNSTITEHWNALQQITHDLIIAADSYQSAITETEHYNQQQQINQTIMQALDGYAPEITFQQFKITQAEIDATILVALDGYDLNITQHYNQASQNIQDIISSLDGYVIQPTFVENKNAQQQINQSIRQALDGYATMAAVVGDIIPSIDNTYQLGTTALRWEELHLANAGVYLEYDAEALGDSRLVYTEVVDSGLAGIRHLARDSFGNFYASYPETATIKKISMPSGTVSTILTGADGLVQPQQVAIDDANILYFVDAGTRNLYKYFDGTLTILYGPIDVGEPQALAFNNTLDGLTVFTSNTSTPGTGGVAVSFTFNQETRTVAFVGTDSLGATIKNPLAATHSRLDSTGKYFTTADHRVITFGFSVGHPYAGISVIAGTSGSAGFSGDGGTAELALLSSPMGIGVDNKDNIFFADYGNSRIRRIDYETKIITTIAGGGAVTTDGYLAIASAIDAYGLAVHDYPDIAPAEREDGYIHFSSFTQENIRCLPFDYSVFRHNYRLQVADDNHNLYITGTKYHERRFVSITEDGYVGIGVENPNERLTLKGALSIGEYIGGVYPPTPTDGYGKLWVDPSTRHLLYMDGYGNTSDLVSGGDAGTAFESFKSAQYQINQSVIQALDGYDLNITQHYNEQAQINQSIIQAADAYGTNLASINSYLVDQTQLNQSVIQAADAYGTNLASINSYLVDQTQFNQTVLKDLDGYALTVTQGVIEQTFQENKNAQAQINQNVLQALDGYALLSIENQRWIDDSQQHADIRTALDGYALLSIENQRHLDTSQQLQDIRDILDADAYVDALTWAENSNALAQINQSVLQALDGYAQNVTVTEHWNALQQINQSILQALDGYTLAASSGIVEQTFQENKNAQYEINQVILQALDGYAQNITVTENFNALKQINQSIFQALDAYGGASTETEHYNQQQQINQSVLQALDGYAADVTVSENKVAQQQINQTIIKALDGYGGSSYFSADGYANGNVYPHTDLENNLGSPFYRWNNVYLGSARFIQYASDPGVGIDGQWLIRTYAGDGTDASSGDAGQSTAAQSARISSIAVDGYGDIYLAQDGQGSPKSIIRKIVKSTGVISTIAGNVAVNGDGGDGSAATSAQLNEPYGLAFDSANNLYFWQRQNNRVRRIQWLSGVIEAWAGTGSSGNTGDGGGRLAATFGQNYGIGIDNNDNVYLCDADYNRVRKVNATTGIISNWAGASAGTAGNTGDGGAATSALLNLPYDIAFTHDGVSAFISDYSNNRIRKVDMASLVISNFAGSSAGTGGFGGDEGPATSALLSNPRGLWVAPDDGYLYISDYGNNRVRAVSLKGDNVISTVTGSGAASSLGDGGAPGGATVQDVFDVASGADGYVYVAEHTGNRLRQVYVSAPTTSGDQLIVNTEYSIRSTDEQKLIIRNEVTGNNTITVTYDGYVGINDTNPPAHLTVNGGLALKHIAHDIIGSSTGYGKLFVNSEDNRLLFVGSDAVAQQVVLGPDLDAYVTVSDARLKTNIEPINGALATVEALMGVRFDWNAEAKKVGKTEGNHEVGLIAQEVERVIPEVVSVGSKGYKQVHYDKLVSVLIQAIKELKIEVDELKKRGGNS